MNSSTMATPEILANTDQWVVVNKPAGWLTIPASGDAPVLVQWLKEETGDVWIVHRLDRETSGVVLFAKSAKDHKIANTWFQDRKVKKVYHCLATGVPRTPILKINQPIEGAPSITQIEVRESYQEGFLARVFPRTGRRHQIRIHLSKAGFPIWGDVLYGGPKFIAIGEKPIMASRVALHASSLEFPTGEKFEAGFSEDFSHWLERLRKEGSRVSS